MADAWESPLRASSGTVAADRLDRWMQCTSSSFRHRSSRVPRGGGRRSVRFVASATSVSSRGSVLQRSEKRIELYLLGGIELRGVDRDVADRLLAQAKLSALLRSEEHTSELQSPMY